MGKRKLLFALYSWDQDSLVSIHGSKHFFNEFVARENKTKEFIVATGQCHSDVAIGPFYYDNQESHLLEKWLKGFG